MTFSLLTRPLSRVLIALSTAMLLTTPAKSQDIGWEYATNYELPIIGAVDCGAAIGDETTEGFLMLYFKARASSSDSARLAIATKATLLAQTQSAVDAIEVVFNTGAQKTSFTMHARAQETTLPYADNSVKQMLEILASGHSLEVRETNYAYSGPEPMPTYSEGSWERIYAHNESLGRTTMQLPLKGSRKAITQLIACIESHSTGAQLCESPVLDGLRSEGFVQNNGIRWNERKPEMAAQADEVIASLRRNVRVMEDYFAQWPNDYASCIRHEPDTKCERAYNLRRDYQHDLAVFKQFRQRGRDYLNCIAQKG